MKKIFTIILFFFSIGFLLIINKAEAYKDCGFCYPRNMACAMYGARAYCPDYELGRFDNIYVSVWANNCINGLSGTVKIYDNGIKIYETATEPAGHVISQVTGPYGFSSSGLGHSFQATADFTYHSSKTQTVNGVKCTAQPCSASCSIGSNVTCPKLPDPNNAPSASILSPSSGITFSNDNSLSLSGRGIDSDGYIQKHQWWLDGSSCGSGTLLRTHNTYDNPASDTDSFSYLLNLSVGDHKIYYGVTDDDNAIGCASISFTIRPSCDPATAPAGTTFCSGDNENLTGGSDITATEVNSSADCTAARKCEYYLLPINGAVGSAHSQIFCQRPSENLCDSGIPSDVTEGDSGQSWIWTCQGLYGGSDTPGKAAKSCAYKETNPN